MKYLKISNITTESGVIDYKGLNIDSFRIGTQYYPHDLIYCITETSEILDTLPQDVQELTKEEYDSLKELIRSTIPKDPLIQKIETMQALLDELVMGGI